MCLLNFLLCKSVQCYFAFCVCVYWFLLCKSVQSASSLQSAKSRITLSNVSVMCFWWSGDFKQKIVWTLLGNSEWHWNQKAQNLQQMWLNPVIQCLYPVKKNGRPEVSNHKSSNGPCSCCSFACGVVVAIIDFFLQIHIIVAATHFIYIPIPWTVVISISLHLQTQKS